MGLLLLLFFIVVESVDFSALLEVERQRLEVFAVSTTDSVDIYYNPKNMPVIVLAHLVRQCPETLSCKLETAQERQQILGKVWEQEIKWLVEEWKTYEIGYKKYKETNPWLYWLWNPESSIWKHNYDSLKRFRYLVKITERKDITPAYLKTVLRNLQFHRDYYPVPLFDVSHVVTVSNIK